MLFHAVFLYTCVLLLCAIPMKFCFILAPVIDIAILLFQELKLKKSNVFTLPQQKGNCDLANIIFNQDLLPE